MSVISTAGTGPAELKGGPLGLGIGRTAFFILVGIAVSVGVATALNYLPYSPIENFFLGLAIAVGAPLVIVLVTIAGWQGIKSFSGLIPNIKWYWWIWFLMFVSDFVWKYNSAQANQANPLDPSSYPRIAAELTIGITLLLGLVRKHVDWPSRIFVGLPGLITIFCMVGLLSTAWSVYPPATAYKCLEFEVDVGILCAILVCMRTSEQYENFANWAWLLQGMQLGWVWVGMIIWPGEAFAVPAGAEDTLPRLQGVIPVVGYNAVAAMGAVLGVVALARLFPVDRKKKQKYWAWYFCLLATGISTLFFAQTRSAIGGFAVAATLVMLLSGYFWFLAALGFGALVILAVTPLGPMAWDYFMRNQDMDQFTSLSGRTDWWAYGYDVWKQHPYNGVGMYVAGKFAVMQHMGTGDTPTLHSDWMEIFVGTSIWGLIPIIALTVGCIWILLRCYFDKDLTLQDRQLSLEFFGVMTYLTIRSFVNVELVWHAPSLFFPVVGWAEYMRRKRKNKRQAEAEQFALAASAP
jgi:hypothetical protein